MISGRTTLLAAILMRAFVSLSLRSTRHVARALTTTTNSCHAASTTRSRGAASAAFGVARSFSQLSSSSPHCYATRPFSSSSSNRGLASTAIEEDLDAALDDILGDAIQEAEYPAGMQTGSHLPETHSIPQNLVEEEDPEDYKDPKFLSTSNPRWVEAGLDARVIDVLSSKGITSFTPVQGEAFDPIMARRDVIGRSRTGTGKTLAFGLPSLTRLVKWTEQAGKRDERGRMRRGRNVSMLILCPTRELARQVQEELSEVAEPLGLFVDVFHGGVSYGPQAAALRRGLDVLVGTPGRVIDHIQRGNLNLSECDIVVLDEADEMLNMGFADDVETILEGVGSKNKEKTQCLMFSATTPPWVKEIGKQYQEDVLAIDSTSNEGGARVAKTVRHMAIQLPPGVDSKKAILEDIIAVEISKDASFKEEVDPDTESNPLAAAAAKKKRRSNHAMQQKIFGKTIVFTETKRDADELVSGGVFKSLTAQALHGDVGQKQRDATLNAFRAGAFNVLVATDVAARGIDISDVDLVVQLDPPRDVDTYVHRSGRTGRAGKKGVSVLLFNRQQARDIVKIERDLGHGFKFELAGPPSTEAALKAAAKTSAIACKTIPDETAAYFQESAAALLENEDAQDIVARCLAAISRRSTEVQSRSLITGELGLATVQMTNTLGRPVAPNDVVFTVGKLARMSRREENGLTFDADVGKIQPDRDGSYALFDMSLEDAKKLIEFSKDIDAGGSVFSLVQEIEIERDRHFGMQRFNGRDRNGRGRSFKDGSRGGGGYYGRDGGRDYGGRAKRQNSYGRNPYGRDHSHTGRSNYEGRHGGRSFRDRGDSGGREGRFRRYDGPRRGYNDDSGW